MIKILSQLRLGMFPRFLDKINLHIFIIFFLIISTSISAKNISLEESIKPFCNGANSEIFINDQKVKKIEILTNNKRAWFRNLMNALVNFNSSQSKSIHKDWFTFRINDDLKKRYDSKIKVFFDNLKEWVFYLFLSLYCCCLEEHIQF